jgi:hypothetical protein
MRYVEDIRESLNRAPDARSTKGYLLELVEVILFRLHTQNELGQWEAFQLSKAVGHLRLNIEGPEAHSSTAWLSAAEVSIVKSLVPPSVRDREAEASLNSLSTVGYEQLMEEIRRLRALLVHEA